MGSSRLILTFLQWPLDCQWDLPATTTPVLLTLFIYCGPVPCWWGQCSACAMTTLSSQLVFPHGAAPLLPLSDTTLVEVHLGIQAPSTHYRWVWRNYLLKKVTESTAQVKRKHSLTKEFMTYFFCGFPEQLGSRFLEAPVDLSLWSPQSPVPWRGAYPWPFHVQKGRNQWWQCMFIKPCIIHTTEDFWQAPYFGMFVKRKNSFYSKHSLDIGELIWNRGIKT